MRRTAQARLAPSCLGLVVAVDDEPRRPWDIHRRQPGEPALLECAERLLTVESDFSNEVGEIFVSAQVTPLLKMSGDNPRNSR
ncbi:hypothetical protein AB0F77_27625 [Streptomyces sp. NPDC026672]|uniref:hypothetical protein n=1 Tax=Streptomyces sp. NPDC026672 TaxID=3155252 RepID=UPI0033EE8AF6